MLTLGVLSAAGAGAGSFSILIGATAQRLPAERRAFASGFINAGGSFGQFVFAPLMQASISAFGWVVAMLTIAAIALLTMPLALGRCDAGACRGRPQPAATAPASAAGHRPAPSSCASPLRDRSYWLPARGLFHLRLPHRLPGDPPAGRSRAVRPAGRACRPRRSRIIGLFNIAGSLTAGALGHALPHEVAAVLDVRQPRRADRALPGRAEDRHDLLRVRGGARLHLAGHGAADRRPGRQAVRRALSRHAVRPDAAVAPDRRLLRRLAGRPGVRASASYQWMWYADIALALAAALVNLPIREARLPARVQPA